MTFETYLRRYKSICEKDCEKWPDKKKVRLLLGKFRVAEHEKYVNSTLLRQPCERTFQETIQILTKIFGEQSSLFNTCWQCLNLNQIRTRPKKIILQSPAEDCQCILNLRADTEKMKNGKFQIFIQ